MSENAFRSLGYNVKGHYRTSIGPLLLPDTLAANARLFTIRNTGTNLLIPTRLAIRAVQAAAGTAQLAAIAAFRVTGFSVSDSTNKNTPVAMVVSARGDMTAAPGSAELASSNGNAAGMTGGTLTKDGSAFSKLPIVVLSAANAYLWQIDMLDDRFGHPLVLANNEGIDIENSLVNTTTFGVSVSIELSWAEVVSFGQ